MALIAKCRPLVLFGCALSGSLGQAAELMPIPAWLPNEPGSVIRYRAQYTRGIPRSSDYEVEIREVTHTADSYSVSANVNSSDGEALAVVELKYNEDQATISVNGVLLIASGLSAVPRVGDKIGLFASQKTVEAGELEVVSTTTTVVKGRDRWDNAVAVAGWFNTQEVVLKATVAAPEGLIRCSISGNEQNFDHAGAIVIEVLNAGR